MRSFLYLALLFSICFACESNRNETTISYTVTHTVIDSIPYLKVEMELPRNESGTTVLEYADQAWGEDSLHNAIYRMDLLEEGAIEINRDSGEIALRYSDAEKSLRFEYMLRQDTDDVIETRDVYRPIIQPEYFQLFTHGLFMLPEELENEKSFNVEINWKLPEDMTIQNSFADSERSQLLKGVSYDDFMSAIFVGGDFRRYDIDIQGNKVSLAIRGDWMAFEDEDLITILEQTMKAQRDFWQDHSQQYFAVSMIPTVQEKGSSFQGTGLTHSFATAASNNENLEVEGLVYLLNHELQHNWTGKKIENDNEEEQYWFSEGFTDYYTWKNIATNNINGLDGAFFISEINKVIKALYASPVKDAPNSEINYDNFWTDRAYAKLPYQRGALFAFYLDHRIQRDTKGNASLDDLMLDFLKDSDTKISHEFFLDKANNYLNEDLDQFFELHIVKGEPMDLSAIFDALELAHTKTAEVFDLGFEWDETQQLITEVRAGSNAEKAGMTEGDTLVGRSYYYDMPDYEASFTVLRNGEELNLNFYPSITMNVPLLKKTAENSDLLGYEFKLDDHSSTTGAPAALN